MPHGSLQRQQSQGSARHVSAERPILPLAFDCNIIAHDWVVRHGLANIVGSRFPGATVNTFADTGEVKPSLTGTPAVALWLPDGINGVDILSTWAQAGRAVVALGEPGIYLGHPIPARWVPEWRDSETAVVNTIAQVLAETYSRRPVPRLVNRRSGPDKRMLTDRQWDVLRLLAQGLSNADIGGLLGMSENTVRIHVSAILKALKLSNRTQAALWAQQNGAEAI
jgi:DNA-binding CsgD family transcriptional regulator